MTIKKCTGCGYNGIHTDYVSCLICGLIFCEYCYKFGAFCLDDFNQLSHENKVYTYNLYKKFRKLDKIMVISPIICMILLIGYVLAFINSFFDFLIPVLVILTILMLSSRFFMRFFYRKILFKHLNKDIFAKVFSKNYKKLRIFAGLNAAKEKLNYFKEKVNNFESKYQKPFNYFETTMKDEKYYSLNKADYNNWQKYIRYSKDIENKIRDIEIIFNSID